MIYLIRVIHESRIAVCGKCTTAVLLCAFALTLSRTWASEIVDSAFSGGTSFRMVVNDSLLLDVNVASENKVYGDINPAGFSGVRSPDVISFAADSFTFFWARPKTALTERIWRRDFKLGPSGAVAYDSYAIDSTGVPPVNYLHADENGEQFVVSFLDDDYSGTIYGTNENDTNAIKLTDYDGAYFSQCHYDTDTFLVSYLINKDPVVLVARKVLSTATQLTSIYNFPISSDQRLGGGGAVWDGRITNSSIAADENGNVFVTMTRGKRDQDKVLDYKYYNRFFNQLDTNNIATNINRTLDSVDFKYDDAPCVSYGPGKYAVTHWDTTGIWLHTLVWNGSTLDKTSQQIVARPGCRYPTLAVNDSFLVVVWKGDHLENGVSGIEAKRYHLRTGNPFDTPLLEQRYSNAGTSYIRDDGTGENTILNAAMDSLGSVGVIWESGNQIFTAIWVYRTTTWPSGYWISPADSVAMEEGDSLKFYPSTLDTFYSNRGVVYDSIQLSHDPAVWNNPWVSLSDSAELEDGTKSDYKYFRYKIQMERDPEDSVYTPLMKKITLPYNVKPVIESINTVSVGGSVNVSPAFNDTDTVYSRLDTISFGISVRDQDSTDTLIVTTAFTSDSTVTLTGARNYDQTFRFDPVVISDTVIQALFSASDNNGWNADDKFYSIYTRNFIPDVMVQVLFDTSGNGLPDTVTVTSNTSFTMQETDSISFLYSYNDLNDPDSLCHFYLRLGADTSAIDSLDVGGSGTYKITGDTSVSAGVRTALFMARDLDTTVVKQVSFGINHFPEIKEILYRGDTLAKGDSIFAIIGDTLDLTFVIEDVDVANGQDSMTYIFSYGTVSDTITRGDTALTIQFAPKQSDTLLSLTVFDNFRVADSATFFYRFPWLALDSADNPAYVEARESLQSRFSLVVGSSAEDTIDVPFVNLGEDTASLYQFDFTRNEFNWLHLALNQNGSLARFDGSELSAIAPLVINTNETKTVSVIVNTGTLSSDGEVYDTLLISTSDPRVPVDSLPVYLEYNDLPRYVESRYEFSRDRPFWLSKKKRGAAIADYEFPPHSELMLGFSEPLDSGSAIGAITIYSVYDSIATGIVQPIPHRQRWSVDYTRVYIRPEYNFSSQHFGLRPPEGMFIPTDSIRVLLSYTLTDTAKTPSGPNPLDVNDDFVRDTSGFKSLSFRVDSITFNLLEFYPDSTIDTVPPNTPIILRFSDGVYPGSIDTSLTDNKTLVVTSMYSGTDTVGFDSVVVAGSRVFFYPEIEFYSNDTVRCQYRSFSARDTLGFPIDGNKDGVPIGLYDSTATDDDIIWHFAVRPITLVAVTPDSASENNSHKSAITLTFSDPLLDGIFDTDTATENLSFQAYSSLHNGGHVSFRDISISQDRLRVTCTPRRAYLGLDTITCFFRGFSTQFSYDSSSNLPANENEVYGAYEWFFRITNEEFYTYPIPYKPSLDPRHCSGAIPESPCGIWFKNLHLLDPSGITTSLRIVVYNMNTHPVFSTKSAGIELPIDTQRGTGIKEWKWHTKNQMDHEVATGIYFYVIYNQKNKALKKGKLLIVR